VSARGAHEQQVRHVGARDEEHQTDRAREDEQGRPDVADHRVLERDDLRHRSLALTTPRALGPAGNGRDVGHRLLTRDAVAHPSDHGKHEVQVRRQSELERAREFLEEDLALELVHGYLKPIDVDTDVALIAVVGEGMRGTPGLAGRIFTAISKHNINIIAIAQGSSELTIAIVVRRGGLEQAVRAIHGEF